MKELLYKAFKLDATLKEMLIDKHYNQLKL